MRAIATAIFIATNLLGLALFAWPLVLPADVVILSDLRDATWLAAAIAAVAVIMIAAQISARLLDSKSVAIVAILVALIAALRLMGAGAVGLEPMWFLLILAARAFGSQLGYAIALLSMLVSALFTGGVGPWLPFQIFAAGWVAIGVALIPKTLPLKFEVVALALYGALAAFLFGFLMDLQLWPWLLGTDTQLSFQSGASVAENLGRFITFHFASALAWDLPRALLTFSLILLTGQAVLNALRRAKHRLGWQPSAISLNARATEQMGV